MEEKLKKLMRHEGINSTRLAEMLGIQASGISHIMSGRNKPSFDFLVKLLERFPQINPDWLIMDKGPMYRDEVKKGISSAATAILAVPAVAGTAQNSSSAQTQQNSGLFAEPVRTYAQPAVSAPVQPLERDDEDIIPSDDPSRNPAMQPSRGFSPSSSIERIVVFYKDKTFSEYQPE